MNFIRPETGAYLVFLIIIFNSIFSNGQNQTVGLFKYLPGTDQGYVFFAPIASDSNYLIDMCGRRIHTWPGSLKPGQGVYFLPDGCIMRSEAINNNTVFYGSGAAGGRIEKIDPQGTVVWSYDYSSPVYIQHHDIEPLPNGNVLLLAYEVKTPAEAKAAGRDTTKIPSAGLWSEHVVEIMPLGPDSGEIVWEWHLWNHLVQDFDSTKDNFGVITNRPGKLNINFISGAVQADFIHMNAIAYNPELDQIMLTSRLTSELYIIDHSTTSQQAAGDIGGNSGKGGRILYRWGNPQVYKRGTAASKQLFGPHDSHWIPKGYPDEGKIIVFNNGVSRPSGVEFSSVMIIQPPVDSLGNYSISPGAAYLPASPYWEYVANPLTSFYSQAISGAQQLMNGNLMICEGLKGRFFEVDKNKNILWEYKSPVIGGGSIISQGNTIPHVGQTYSNCVFKIQKLPPDFPGLNHIDLTPKGPIELNAYPDTCAILSTDEKSNSNSGIYIYPNPANSTIFIELVDGFLIEEIEIINSLGGKVYRKAYGRNESNLINVELSGLTDGLYFVKLRSGGKTYYSKILKQKMQ